VEARLLNIEHLLRQMDLRLEAMDLRLKASHSVSDPPRKSYRGGLAKNTAPSRDAVRPMDPEVQRQQHATNGGGSALLRALYPLLDDLSLAEDMPPPSPPPSSTDRVPGRDGSSLPSASRGRHDGKLESPEWLSKILSEMRAPVDDSMHHPPPEDRSKLGAKTAAPKGTATAATATPLTARQPQQPQQPPPTGATRSRPAPRKRASLNADEDWEAEWDKEDAQEKEQGALFAAGDEQSSKKSTSLLEELSKLLQNQQSGASGSASSSVKSKRGKGKLKAKLPGAGASAVPPDGSEAQRGSTATAEGRTASPAGHAAGAAEASAQRQQLTTRPSTSDPKSSHVAGSDTDEMVIEDVD
jgi:hypothetical protein